jgi:predicted dehydrogenase
VKKINVGLIGYKFMGKAHSHAFKDMSMFFDASAVPVMKVICGRNEEAVKDAADRWGWQEYDTSWERVVEREDIHLIDICTSNDTHRDIAVAAAEMGKDILLEKPMASSLAEAKEMLAVAEKAGVKHMINFNYRRCPAIQLAKRLIDEGFVGRIYHVRAEYLQDWIMDPDFPLVWRLRKELAGSGALGDIGAHIVDLARFLVGEFHEVNGLTTTFIKERPLLDETTGDLSATGLREKGQVTVDDAAIFMSKFKNGAVGSFEATRFANGRKNHERIEINGSEGSIVFNFERMNELQVFSSKDPEHIQGFRTILVTEEAHPYIKAWWPPGHIIGYEHTFVNQVYELMEAIAEDRMPEPNFYDGVKCQEVLEAVERSNDTGQWVKIGE